MSPAQLAPTNRIARPSRAAPAPLGRTSLSAAEADRLIRSCLADVYVCPHADTERNPVVEA